MRARKRATSRVMRGGTYDIGTRFLRVTFRDYFFPMHRSTDYGFRFVIRGKK